MVDIDDLRSTIANLQIDNYQITKKIEMLEERFEILELKLNQILDAVGAPNVH